MYQTLHFVVATGDAFMVATWTPWDLMRTPASVGTATCTARMHFKDTKTHSYIYSVQLKSLKNNETVNANGRH